MIAADQVKTFDPNHWAQPLSVPRGTRYIEADTIDEITEALTEGLAIHSVSCGGHVFIWPDESGKAFRAEHFFQGPPAPTKVFRSPEEAAAFASSCCR